LNLLLRGDAGVAKQDRLKLPSVDADMHMTRTLIMSYLLA